jgi:hypothetical protein
MVDGEEREILVLDDYLQSLLRSGGARTGGSRENSDEGEHDRAPCAYREDGRLREGCSKQGPEPQAMRIRGRR